ncbi:Uncharacterised protein [Grimontia hollisae]|uniref:Uncharacterized protein n=1 Tax=Grimontia hollisae TaxID=673 RepID=A0A377HQZ3_GRIHO|nr:Uncharacterised protein [Grimontia hollisae]STO58162.1 Uncharacterised protein [Grimontia hollisae]STQ76688.1 Uncharacterised protein [Grimontia hollisae]
MALPKSRSNQNSIFVLPVSVNVKTRLPMGECVNDDLDQVNILLVERDNSNVFAVAKNVGLVIL